MYALVGCGKHMGTGDIHISEAPFLQQAVQVKIPHYLALWLTFVANGHLFRSC